MKKPEDIEELREKYREGDLEVNKKELWYYRVTFFTLLLYTIGIFLVGCSKFNAYIGGIFAILMFFVGGWVLMREAKDFALDNAYIRGKKELEKCKEKRREEN